MSLQSLHQNLNQIMQICNQLSQNEQANVNRLVQLQDYERTAAQQLQRCIQLAQQISGQMNQLQAGTQFAGAGMNVGTGFNVQPAGGFQPYPAGGAFQPGMVGGSQFGGVQSPGAGQWTTHTGFESAREFGGTQQHQVFNTNKDRGE